MRWIVDLQNREVVAATWCDADCLLFYLPCISLHATCCVDSDFLFGYKCTLVCACVFRVVIAMFAFCLTFCFQQVFWFCCLFTVPVVSCCCVGDWIVSCF